MASSSIKQKRCRCGCNKYPTMGCGGYNYACEPAEMKEAREAKKKSRVLYPNRLSGMSFSPILHEETFVKNKAFSSVKSGGAKSISTLIEEADNAVRQEMRRTYSDVDGKITCYCCGREAKVDDKVDPEDPQSFPIIQVGHFIKREVKSLRWDLTCNIRPICDRCNNDMDKNKTGKAWEEYRRKLVLEIGEQRVSEMELAHRKVNKVDRAELIELINNLKQ